MAPTSPRKAQYSTFSRREGVTGNEVCEIAAKNSVYAMQTF
jgi:hypothetical protein